jgi:type VI secretion system secreted protein VgrG
MSESTTVITKIESRCFSRASLLSMSADECLSGIYTIHLRLATDSADLESSEILGSQLAVHCFHENTDKERYFHGYIVDATLDQWTETGRPIVNVTMAPWLWFLTRSQNCKIFQALSIPDIIKQVFETNGFSDVTYQLAESYTAREYCVQYQESDFAFVSRLMEEEGIYYFFKHSGSGHSLVVTDSSAGHYPLRSGKKVPYYPPTQNVMRQSFCVSHFGQTRQIRSNHIALMSFDFKKPRASLMTKNQIQSAHELGDAEIFDYSGRYTEFSSGERYARIRNEEQAALVDCYSATCNVLDLAPGSTFELTDFPLGKLNQAYVAYQCSHHLVAESENSVTSSAATHSVTCSVLKNKTPYRPTRSTPKPRIAGPQTAIVVGPSGEEIFTDNYGRIKVRFHWDRYANSNENDSCWIRVAQAWAGMNWGAIYLPRTGQEIVVSFLDGDPDRPLITGRVYNADNMPPYELPAEKTKSGMRSRSTKDAVAQNYNEIAFEDKLGSELLTIHAEKDQLVEVENDETHTVGHNRTRSVGNDESVSIGNNRKKTVAKNESSSIGNNRDESVGNDESISVGHDYSTSIGNAESRSVGQNRTTDIGNNDSHNIGANHVLSVDKDQSLQVGKKRNTNIGDDDNLNVGKNLNIQAADQITLQAGSAKIILKKNGDIIISGNKIQIKGSGDVAIKGSKVSTN